MSPEGASTRRHGRLASFWAERRARWTLPLVIIVVIVIVATVDHIGAHRISEVDRPIISDLVPAKGGSVTVDLSRPWNGFNPGTASGAASSTPVLLSQVLPSAFNVSPGLLPVLNANLLKSVEVTSTAPLTIRYVINPAAVWSDGVPVNAQDFVYAWRSQRGVGAGTTSQPGQVTSSLGYRDIRSVQGSNGGKTVTVVFSQPFTDWRMLFSGMVPAHVAQKVGWSRGFRTFNPAVDLSAGPFLVHSITRGGAAILVRNPRWWGTKALLRRVVVEVTPDATLSTAELASSDQTVFEPSTFGTDALASVSSLPNTESTLKPSLSFVQLEFNVSSPITSALAMRQAIAHAINRPVLLADTVGLIDPSLQVSQDHLALPSQPAYQASSAASEYDAVGLGAVDRLLTSLGFQKASTGRFVDANGHPLTVRMAVESGNPVLAGVGKHLVSQLKAAGITVVLIPVAGVAGLAAASAAGGYDMALVTQTASAFPTATIGWFSNSLGSPGTGGSTDWSNFNDPDVDHLFSQAARDLNPVTGAAVYAQIDDALWSQMVSLPLFGQPGFVANGVQVSNVQFNASSGGILWNLADWTTLKPKPTVSH